MSELNEYYRLLADELAGYKPLWQATVIAASGSTPARTGMRLAIPLTDAPFGNLGGGEMEFTVINLIRRTKPRSIIHLSFDLDEKGNPQLVNPQGRAVRENSEQLQTKMICGGAVEVMVEPLFASHPLYIFGAGHCGRALAELAVKADFQPTVIDNRPEILKPRCFPEGTELLCSDYSDLQQAIPFEPECYIVIMTHGHLHDKQVLAQCLRQPFRYLGMIGSKKKTAETMAQLKKEGFTSKELNKVHAPVGLPIGSHTPYEIAVSILAQLIQIRNLLP